jgi:FHS family L-fucose permease-like MFS transporter
MNTHPDMTSPSPSSPVPDLRKSKLCLAGMFRTADGRSHLKTYLLVCCLFCLSGLCNGMIDVLNKHFQNSLQVSKAQSALVQGFWYGGYFLLALPAGIFARRYGYRGGILFGLSVIAVGCVCFVPVTKIVAGQSTIFGVFLLALGLVACGFTFIETIANPYATVLGSPEAGVARINLAQSCNAVGWIFGPLLGGSFILSKTAQANTSNAELYVPYLIVAGIVTTLLVAFILAPVPDLHAAPEAKSTVNGPPQERPLSREWHFVLAIVSQFLYCAAQIGIFSFFINYLKDPHSMPALPSWLAELLPANMKYVREEVWHITDYCAGAMLSLAFIFFTLGRFSGSAILRFAPAHRVLGIYALCNVVLMGLVCLGLGWVSVAALILSFFFMSIMYPTHFALAIRGLGERTKLASSWMVTAVVGGSVMPIVMGWLADHYSMRVGFLMPLLCFVCIMAYGFGWSRLYNRDAEPEL